VKKIVKIVLLMMIIVSMSGCLFQKYDYSDWKTIKFKKEGTVMIPNDWEYYEEDGLLYIVDKNGLPIMIETHSYPAVGEYANEIGDEESNKFFRNYTDLYRLESCGLSNSSFYGKDLVMKDKKVMEKYVLGFGIDESIDFIVWDERINEKFVKKIATSYCLP